MKGLLRLLLIFCASGTRAQQTPAIKGMVSDEKGGSVLNKYMTAIDTLRSRRPIEKLYLQTDKNYYLTGDTLWFKAYLLNGDFLTPSQKSGLLYVELDDAAGRMEKRIMVPVVSGIGWGNMELDEKEIPEGSYTLRAYTNWMRNFGEDYIFKKDIYISALKNQVLVNSKFSFDSLTNKVTADLLFAGLDKNALRLKDMQYKVMNGRHSLFRDNITTDMNGAAVFKFGLDSKTGTKNLNILIHQTGKGADTSILTIPVPINRPEKADLQFMPEGGNLVAGIPTKVGFKAIGEDGKGTDITGKIVDSENKEIAKIKSIHKGMGSFELTPQAGESYSAVVALPGKTTKTYPLPSVNATGTAIRVTAKGNDSLLLTITTSATNTTLTTNYYLISQSRGVICYAATISFPNGVTTVKKDIAKSLFPTDITRFSLLNQQNTPLNERLVYIDHHDYFNISIVAHQTMYTTRDSIALNIAVKDKDGKPVTGNFSLAVTDNNQVKQDTLGENMLNNLLFTSDLRGTIEEPGWYFENTNSNCSKIPTFTTQAEALDDLLLTQGWVGYDWNDVFDLKLPKYQAESDFEVQGRVTNVLGKPLQNVNVMLIGRTPSVFRDTTTNEAGIFTFAKLFPVYTAQFKMEARNKNGKDFNVGVEVLSGFKAPVFTAGTRATPWYINSDTTLLNSINLKAQEDLKLSGHFLKEVVIKDVKTIKDSQRDRDLYGDPDIEMGEDDLLKYGKMSLLDILEKKIKGFGLIRQDTPDKNGFNRGSYRVMYAINATVIMHFYFDGITVEQFNHYNFTPYLDHFLVPPNPMWKNYIFAAERMVTEPLKYFKGEDLKGIEIWWKGHSPVIEITTRAGRGPEMRATAGTAEYNAMPFTLPKQFYRPRYTLQNANIALGTDLRSTIHWEPNLVMNADGKRTISFFSADKPGDYTIIMEGTDMNGNLAYKRKIIKVGTNIAAVK
ncbi:MAG: hypothetical protein JWQ79_433 [Mucilaginibacter sp.]|nr:hypothetical protein [Mucilaginibacter sp.]